MLDLDRIRERAHAIWESAGKPDGSHDEHWEQACREIEAEDSTNLSDQVSAPDAGPARSGS